VPQPSVDCVMPCHCDPRGPTLLTALLSSDTNLLSRETHVQIIISIGRPEACQHLENQLHAVIRTEFLE